MQRILLTGSRGFVGTRLLAALAHHRPDAVVMGLDSGIDHRKPNSGESGVDLLDCDAVMACVRDAAPDTAIHLAAQSSVAQGDGSGAARTWQVNLAGSLNFALAVATHAPNATVLFASSSEVYGASFLASPVTETSPLLPMNAYARSKAQAERVLADVLPATARLIVARPFNHTGAGQREDFVLPSFAGQVARIEAGLQPPRMMAGNLDVRRDFLNVRDVVGAYLALLDAAPTLPTRFTCNIASGRAQPLRAYAEILQGMAKIPFEIVVDPTRLRPVDVSTAYADPALLRAATGWAPTIAIEETLAELLAAARRGHGA